MFFGCKLANLQIAARGDVRFTTAPIAQPCRPARASALKKNAARRAQPQHERVLRGRNVEEPVKLEAEDIATFRKAIVPRMRKQLLPDVERVFLVLDALFLAQLIDRSTEVRLFLRRSEIGSAGCRVGSDQAASGVAGKECVSATSGGQHKAGKVFFLLLVKSSLDLDRDRDGLRGHRYNSLQANASWPPRVRMHEGTSAATSLLVESGCEGARRGAQKLKLLEAAVTLHTDRGTVRGARRKEL